MTDRKHPSIAVWIAVALVAVLVLYPLSVGPVFRLLVRSEVDFKHHWACIAYRIVYAPIHWIYNNSPEEIHSALDWYCGIE